MNIRIWLVGLCVVVMPVWAWASNPVEPSEEDVAAAQETIGRLYQEILGRAPDPSGLVNFVPLLAKGEHDEDWLGNVLRQSPEGRSRQARLEKARRTQRAERMRAFGVGARLALIWLGLFALFALMGRGISEFVLGGGGLDGDRPDLFQAAWIGLGGLLVVIQFWSLVWPVNEALLGLCVLGALAGLARAARRQRGGKGMGTSGDMPVGARWSRWLPGLGFGLLMMSIGMVGAAANAHYRMVGYDTLLYHFNAVRWANEYAVVPGLANLHIRLGNNSAWLLLAAWIDHGPLDGRTAWVMPGFACVFFLGHLLHMLIAAKTVGTATRMVAFLLLPYGLRELTGVYPHLYFDAPAQFALAVTFLELVRWGEGRMKSKAENPSFSAAAAMCIGAPAAISFVIKPIGALALVPVGSLLAWGLWRNIRLSGWRGARRYWGYGLPLLILLGWVARNVFLSGWLLFPAPLGALPVDWAVPRSPASASHADQLQSVEGHQQIIQAWARSPGPTFLNAMGAPLGKWMPDWYDLRKQSVELRWLFPLGLVSLVASWGIGRKRKSLKWWGVVWPATVFALLAFWLQTAPDLRFGRGLFWMWFAICGGLAAASLVPVVGMRNAFAAVVLASLAFSWEGLRYMPVVLEKSPWMWGRAESAPVKWVEVNDQNPPLGINVPLRGDQCGDSPLPGTPYPSDRLMARTPGDMGRGFRRAPPP